MELPANGRLPAGWLDQHSIFQHQHPVARRDGARTVGNDDEVKCVVLSSSKAAMTADSVRSSNALVASSRTRNWELACRVREQGQAFAVGLPKATSHALRHPGGIAIWKGFGEVVDFAIGAARLTLISRLGRAIVEGERDIGRDAGMAQGDRPMCPMVRGSLRYASIAANIALTFDDSPPDPGYPRQARGANRADRRLRRSPSRWLCHQGRGEHGMLLSGGQRQRLVLARALYKQAPISWAWKRSDKCVGRANGIGGHRRFGRAQDYALHHHHHCPPCVHHRDVRPGAGAERWNAGRASQPATARWPAIQDRTSSLSGH